MTEKTAENDAHSAGRDEVRIPGLVRDIYVLDVEFLLPSLSIDVAGRQTNCDDRDQDDNKQ